MSSPRVLTVEPLTREAFAPFGDVISTVGADSFPINNGRTQRFHALGTVQLLGEGAEGIFSIFRGQPLEPLQISLMERHPLGSQAFVPLNGTAFYAVVAAPGDFDESAVRAALEREPGVAEVHDLHIWPMSTTETALTAHLVMPDGHPGDAFIAQLAQRLSHDHQIGHTTLQIERTRDCKAGC